ncbi:hypothetical protein BDR26DRAFT_855816 [Obelidium mucronatum]|nr:hypothetical protein BDR26DRAFT_855816 [Obelidium mucronatum]
MNPQTTDASDPTAALLERLPSEVLVAILVRVGPLASALRPCFQASRSLNAAAWQALAHGGLQFENMSQRKRFAERLMLLVGVKRQRASARMPENTVAPSYPHSLSPSGDSAVDLINDSHLVGLHPCGGLNVPSLTHDPMLPRFEHLIETLRHLDFGFKPNTPIGMPVNSEPSTPPNTPFPSTVGGCGGGGASHHHIHPYPLDYLSTIKFYGNQWDHRFIAEELILILQSCPNLRSLNLSGCQLKLECIDTLVDSLKALPFGIQYLDLSNSSLKGWALLGIVEACRESLKVLNISGLFRFRRNNATVLYKLVESCPHLHRLIANQCPDIDQDLFMHISLMAPHVKFRVSKSQSSGYLGGGGGGGGRGGNSSSSSSNSLQGGGGGLGGNSVGGGMSAVMSLASSSTSSLASSSSSLSSLSSSRSSLASSLVGSPVLGGYSVMRLDRVATIDEE